MPAPRTVAEYLATLTPDRRTLVSKVRTVVKKAMPAGYKEVIAFGMIAWVVPLTVLPKTYNGQPLLYVGLGAHKSHVALYLMGVYGHAPTLGLLKAGYQEAGLKLDMEKSCVRFRTLAQVDLPTIARVVSAIPMAKYVEAYRAVKG